MNLHLGDTQAIIAYAAAKNILRNQLAYILATGFHETGGAMKPIKETVMSWHKDKNPSDAVVISRLNAAYKKGQLPWVKAPYWLSDADGKSWFGRGISQITHKRNYIKLGQRIGVNLTADPDRALNSGNAVKILVAGSMFGDFTGKALPDYITLTKSDYFNARDVINGDKHKRDDGVKMGDRIAKYAREYDAALTRAGYGVEPHRPAVQPDVDVAPAKPVTPPTRPKSGGYGGIAAAVAAMLAALAAYAKGWF